MLREMDEPVDRDPPPPSRWYVVAMWAASGFVLTLLGMALWQGRW